jgi:MtfA peptidase
MIFGFFKRRRRNKVKARPFPVNWREILERNVPYVSLLNPEQKSEIEGHVQILVDEKTFVGCGGLEMNDEIRVSIAAGAAILLLNRKTDYYPGLDSILVYPAAYVGKSLRSIPGGGVMETEETRLGESWSSGQVVFSWDDAQRGAADMHDGHNVVLHEFAHQLDSEFDGGSGAPRLQRGSMYVAWARVLGREYEHLLEDLGKHHRTIIDAYGATNPAEFFAVVTETFFERPVALQKRHPELYDQIKSFYLQDPVKRYRRDD